MSSFITSKYDLGLLISTGILLFIGLVTLASSGGELFSKQLIWLIPSLILILGIPLINPKSFFNYRWIVYSGYFVVLGLLVITYFVAPSISGARAWIPLGSFQIQPSEFMKAALIILLSSFFAAKHVAIARLGIIFQSFIYMIIPTALILLQPDLGTVLVLFGIWFSYLLLSGLKFKHLMAAILVLIILVTIGWNFLLFDYQKARISALFNPEADPLGVNYSVIQSKIAIGSGGFWGKGFGQGTQAHLGFLPAAHTDFAFSTFVEEWGLFGGLILIGTFIYLIYRIMILGIESKNNFSKFMALGTVLMISIHFVINLGSATGLLPVIGVGLPLVSYGGSNLLTLALLLGIIQGVCDTRHRI